MNYCIEMNAPGGSREDSMANLEILDDKHAVAVRGVEIVVASLNSLLVEQGKDKPRITVALAGGTTPRVLYQLMSREPWHSRIPWESIDWFLGDERVVPQNHEQSNFRMLRENLFDPAGVAEENRFRMMTEMPTAEAAAADYAECLRDFVSSDPNTGAVPVFDLMFLGMGADGHTASLFPHTTALERRDALVLANYVEKLSTWRLTVTPSVIEAARQVVIMVTGGDKAEALSQVLEGEWNPAEYPAQILRALPTVTWLVDSATAERLQQYQA